MAKFRRAWTLTKKEAVEAQETLDGSYFGVALAV